jgi:hypothetical protein
VATDIMGKSGRAMLAALIDGTTDPGTMATLAKGRLREKREELARALGGRIASHQRFMLVEQLSHIDTLEETIDRVSAGSLRAWSRARHNWRRSTRSRASASG